MSAYYGPSAWEQRVSDFATEADVNVRHLNGIAKIVEDTTGVLAKLESGTQDQLKVLQDPNVMSGETAAAIRAQLTQDLQQVQTMNDRLINSRIPGMIRDATDAVVEANTGIQSLNRGWGTISLFGARLPVGFLGHWEQNMLDQSQPSVDNVRSKYEALTVALEPYITGTDQIAWHSATG